MAAKRHHDPQETRLQGKSVKATPPVLCEGFTSVKVPLMRPIHSKLCLHPNFVCAHCHSACDGVPQAGASISGASSCSFSMVENNGQL